MLQYYSNSCSVKLGCKTDSLEIIDYKTAAFIFFDNSEHTRIVNLFCTELYEHIYVFLYAEWQFLQFFFRSFTFIYVG